MTPSPACFALVKRFEGLSLKAYPDPATGGEPITIGYGHTGGIHLGTIWTQDEADTALMDDLHRFGATVSTLLGGAPTKQCQFDALTSWIFNVGAGAAATSTLLRMHIAGNFAGAGDQFLRWNKAAGRVMPGLVKRREAERALYLGEAK